MKLSTELVWAWRNTGATEGSTLPTKSRTLPIGTPRYETANSIVSFDRGGTTRRAAAAGNAVGSGRSSTSARSAVGVAAEAGGLAGRGSTALTARGSSAPAAEAGDVAGAGSARTASEVARTSERMIT